MKLRQILLMVLMLGLVFSIAAQGSYEDNQVAVGLDQTDSDNSDLTETATDETDHKDETTGEETSTHDEGDDETDHETDKEDKEDEEEEKDKLEFKVELEVGTEEMKLKTEIDNGTNSEEFKGVISFSGSPEIKVEYSSEVGSNETESEIKVSVYSLIEFEDVDGDGLFGENDTELQVYKLEEIGFSDLIYTTQDLGLGMQEHVVNATTVDGIFTMVFRITEGFTQSNGMTMKPTAVKIDYIISNFTYVSNSSLLALDTKVESKLKVEHDEDSPDEEDQLASNEAAIKTAGKNTAFFSWVKTAEVDGQTTDVGVVISSSGDHDQSVYFVYQHGDLIIHDPTVGVQTSIVKYAIDVDLGRIDPAVLSSAASTLPASSVIAVFTVLISSAIILRRRK